MKPTIIFLGLCGLTVSILGLPEIPRSCRAAKCRCTATGDPHYKTHDGQMIHFQGTCRYTLTQSTTKNDKCAFNVEVKNENRYGNNRVSWTRMVVVEIYGLEILLLPKKKVRVNREEKFLPFSLPDGSLRVTRAGGLVTVETECGITVSFNGIQNVIVEVPSAYSNKMTGICGDCDGVQNDWRTRAGADVSELKQFKRDRAIGKSYLVEEDFYEVEERCLVAEPPPVCDEATHEKFMCAEFCGLIIDTTGPFRECILSGLLEVEGYFESCRQDLCAYEDDDEEQRKFVCESVGAFAAACNAEGFIVVWRKSNFCPVTCPENQKFSPSVNACPPTCGSPSPADFCEGPSVEGCQCVEGFVLNDNNCTKKEECGCSDDDGDYLPIGEARISDDCTTLFACVWDSETQRRSLDKTVISRPCHADAVCAVNGSDKFCVCKEGFDGDGFNCEEIIPTTAPPCELKADIGIVMDSSSSVGKANYKIMKNFLSDIVTNFDIQPDKVRIAVVSFNKEARIEFSFDQYPYESAFPEAIQNISSIRIGTKTHLALKLAREGVFSTAREGVPKIAIVVTDGRSKIPSATRKEARLLHEAGVTVFCIGIGEVSQKEINSISSDPDADFTFTVKNFDALEKIKETVKRGACEAVEEIEAILR